MWPNVCPQEAVKPLRFNNICHANTMNELEGKKTKVHDWRIIGETKFPYKDPWSKYTLQTTVKPVLNGHPWGMVN